MKIRNKIFSGILLSTLLLTPTSTYALEKEETVYANLTYNGKEKTSTVVNKLTYQGQKEITDETELKKILNINGEEKYVLDGNKLTWKTKKKDIYYQGKTKKKLPITVKVSYYLNGKKTSAKKLNGKKGDIKVVIKLKNNENNTYQGKTIYTPFVVTVGTIIDNNNNTNLEVENGKVVDTGTKSMIAMVASPGLSKSMNMSELKSLDQVSYTYHTEKFKGSDMYIVATPKLLDDSDLKVFDKMDESLSKVEKLQKGTDELQNGSNELAKGTTTLKTELEHKMTELENSNNTSVGESAKNKVTTELNNNLSSLVQNTVYNVVKTKVNKTKEAVISNGVQTNCASLSGTPAYDSCIESVKNNVTTDMVISYYNPPTYGEIKAGLSQVLSYYTAQTGNAISEENKNLATLISYQVSGILSTTDYAKYILEEGTYGGYIIPTFNQVFNGVISCYGSIASNVALEVSNQAKNQTLTSLQTMYQAITKIDLGANQLSGGVTTLNKSGINTLSSVANKYKDYTDIVKELKRLSKDYKGFTSKNSKNTKFIYKINATK